MRGAGLRPRLWPPAIAASAPSSTHSVQKPETLLKYRKSVDDAEFTQFPAVCSWPITVSGTFLRLHSISFSFARPWRCGRGRDLSNKYSLSKFRATFQAGLPRCISLGVMLRISLCMSVCSCEDTFRRGCFREAQQRALPADSLPSTRPPTGEGNRVICVVGLAYS